MQNYHFTHSKDPLLFNYLLFDQPVERVTSIKDLGIVFDSFLTFNGHIDAIVNKALKLLGFIKRNTKSFQGVNSIKTLYLSLVRSCLEYGCSIWSPSYAVHVNRIEFVQHKFIKYVSFKMHLHHLQLPDTYFLSLLKIPTLELRRRNFDVILLHKLINNMFDTSLLHLINFHVPNCKTRNKTMFYISNVSTNFLLNSPINRACTYTNSLNVNLNDFFSSTLVSFKKSLPR